MAAPIMSAALALALAAGPASASTTVRGKLKGGKGYVVTGTTASGEGASERLGASGRFTLRFRRNTGRGASLQLIRPNGRYLGPIVLRHEGRTAYVALSGRSLDLGTIRLRSGYAAPARQAPRNAVSARRRARANARGRPRGAGRLGLVAGSKGRSAATARSEDQQGEDPDRDGIASAFDADDDGDLLLDGSDRDNSGESGGIFSTVFVELNQSLNVNIGAVDGAAIDTLLREHLNLIFYFDDGQFRGRTVTSGDVDCFSLPYCAPGTGSALLGGVVESSPDLPRGQPWISYDLNGDGLPNLEPIGGSDGRRAHVASVLPQVGRAQIAPGDTYSVIFTTSGGTVTLPRTLPPYFVTTPAITTYDSGGGRQAVSYPVAQGAPGTASNPIPLASERLTLTFHRPQRPAIGGAEPGSYVDMGHLHYGIPLEVGNQEVGCLGDYSNLSSTLQSEAAGDDKANELFPLADTAEDAAPSADRALSFTLDLGSCMRGAGVSPAGQTLRLGLTATGESRPGGVDRAAQTFYARMPG